MTETKPTGDYTAAEPKAQYVDKHPTQNADAYQRQCAICGRPIEKGQAKDKEHVISRWALRWTDSLDLVDIIHWDYEKGEPKEFSRDQYKFPVHVKCNRVWSSEIESPAAVAFKKFSAGNDLSDHDVLAIMVWADKTRAMSEFAVKVLEKNPFKVLSHYPPMAKIGLTDRIMHLHRFPGRTPPYIADPSLPAFHRTPTALHIRIADVGLVFATDVNLLRHWGEGGMEGFPRITKSPRVEQLVAIQVIDTGIRSAMRYVSDPRDLLKPIGHGKLCVFRHDPPSTMSWSREPHRPPRASPVDPLQLERVMNLDTLRWLRLTQAKHIEGLEAHGPVTPTLKTVHQQLKDLELKMVNLIEAYEIPPGDTIVPDNTFFFRTEDGRLEKIVSGVTVSSEPLTDEAPEAPSAAPAGSQTPD